MRSRLSNKPYAPPLAPSSTQTPSKVTEQMCARASAAAHKAPIKLKMQPVRPLQPLASAPAPSGGSTPQLPLLQQLPRDALAASQAQQFDGSATTQLLTAWLGESLQINARFDSTAEGIYKEMAELKTLPSSICTRIEQEEGSVPWCHSVADEEGGETIFWAVGDDDGESGLCEDGGPALASDEATASRAREDTAIENEDTQGSDSDLSAR